MDINIFASSIVTCFILFIICIAVYCEIRDQKIITKSKKDEWEEIRNNNDFKKYLSTVSNYPSWRLGMIISFGLTLILIPLNILLVRGLFPCIDKKYLLYYILLNSVIVFSFSSLGCYFLMNYFLWHVVCPGWGCSYN